MNDPQLMYLRVVQMFFWKHLVRKGCIVHTLVRRFRSFLSALCSLTAEDQILLKNMQELSFLPLLQRTTAAIIRLHEMQATNNMFLPPWSNSANTLTKKQAVLILHKHTHLYTSTQTKTEERKFIFLHLSLFNHS